MKKFVIKYRSLIVFLLIIIVVTGVYSRIVKHVSKNYNGVTIVLDAGHGGRDGGCVGQNGTVEKDINLEYVLCLKEKLVSSGYRVVLTRKDDSGLYSPTAANKKVSDMNKRMEIINEANPSLVISVHMNSFSDKSVHGAVSYYKVDDEASKNCADLIQKCLKTYCDVPIGESKEGDYFMLNCSYYTSVLIECGFLSNPDEEYKLSTDEYKELVTDSIFKGVLLYFGQKGL